jgi:hypothetical protein
MGIELLTHCMLSEAASESLPIAEALRMLRLTSADELREWAKSRGREWDIDAKSGIVRLREEHKTDIEVLSLFPVYTLSQIFPRTLPFLHFEMHAHGPR